ncbi:hypothetical protein BDP27DRAFT_1426837 [Rhodocollybia butyracea]|uniref:Uncharacterized protein n=1 Tax=Rhodocollybia butyracea TaxID=206335 RepID=A0A9P5PHR3_9AGAR|nr:hypothetical protein BDP27DRAFT_1426837 [Rhodocollybia butyracea]
MDNEEIVADSEGEDEMLIPPRISTLSANVSTISEFSVNKVTAGETISDFSSVIPQPRPLPRPKPRPIQKPSDSSILNTFSMTPTIADRAKMRKRGGNSSSSSAVPEVIELSDDDDDEFSLFTPKKPKPKNKTIKKKTAPVNRIDTPEPSLPIATSPILNSNALLPPSDPPQSTPSDDFQFPPIEILPNIASSVSTSTRTDVDIDMDMPPPPFFAPDSSPVIIAHDKDSALMPPPATPPLAVVTKAKKPRTKKKKNDDEDDYADEASTAPKGKKTKPKGKEKARDKPPAKAKADKSSKKKGKEKAAPQPQEFKSHEFVDEADDDEIDEMLMSTFTIKIPARSKTQPQPSPPGAKRGRGPSDVADEKEGEESFPTDGPRKKMRIHDDNQEDQAVADPNEGIIGSSVSISPVSMSTGNKGRKGRVVLSDDEAEEIDIDIDMDVRESPVAVKKSKGKAPAKSKAKAKSVASTSKTKASTKANAGNADASDEEAGPSSSKENICPPSPLPKISTPSIPSTPKTPTPDVDPKSLFKYPSLTSRYTIAPPSTRKSTPMSELIRRVNSMPNSNSQFKSPMPKGAKGKGSGKAGQDEGESRTSEVGSNTPTYSPYLKSSRAFLSRIAPLHPNRRTPPPAPPPAPKKKTRKEIEWDKKDKEEKEELEDKWEQELVESLGGIGEWMMLGEEQRKMMKRAKKDRELGLGGWEE